MVSDAIITKYRKGDDTDPYVRIIEQCIVLNGKVQLAEIPDKLTRVKVTGAGITWFETEEEIEQSNEFHVDYSVGIVTFNPEHNGKLLTFDYKGKGLQYIPASRVYLNVENGEPTDILKDLLYTIRGEAKVASNYLKIGKNLFNKATAHIGRMIDHQTGLLVDNAAYFTSEKIPVIEGKTITINTSYALAWFDATGKFVTGIPTNTSYPTSPRTVTVPNGVFYLQVSSLMSTLDTFQVEYGNTATEYERYYVEISGLKVELEPNFLDTFHYKNGSITPEKLSFPVPEVISSKNIFDKNKATKGYYVDPANGQLVSSSFHFVSDYIPVVGGLQYSFNRTTSLRVAYYDVTKKFISGEPFPATSPITVPINASYLRFSLGNTDPNVVQLEKGTVSTDYNPYGIYINHLLNGKYIGDDVINLTDKIYGTVGLETNIYFRNLLKEKLENYNVRVTSTIGKQMKDRFTVIPTETGTYPITIDIFDKNELIATKTVNFIVNGMRTTPKKVMVLGDSTIFTKGYGYVTQRLLENLGTNVELIGTLGTDLNKHEGRGAWSAAMYRTNTLFQDLVNPFYNPTKKDFDFAYYMTNNGFTEIDVVILNLGIYDTFNFMSDEEINSNLYIVINNFNFLINNILAYNPNIKVAWNVTIPPNENQDVFGALYDTKQTQWRYKYNNFIWVKEGIKYFKDKIDLIPIFATLDVVNNMEDALHPTEVGYRQIGDQITSYLNSLT